MDPQGRIVYRGAPRFDFRGRGPGAAGGPPQIPEMPDSAAIFRIDLATRKVDTLGVHQDAENQDECVDRTRMAA